MWNVLRYGKLQNLQQHVFHPQFSTGRQIFPKWWLHQIANQRIRCVVKPTDDASIHHNNAKVGSRFSHTFINTGHSESATAYAYLATDRKSDRSFAFGVIAKFFLRALN